MTPPWRPDDQRWGYLFLGALVLVFFALMFGGRVFGQGDPRPQIQTVPIMTIDSAGRLVIIGDFPNRALRVNNVAGASATGQNGNPSAIIACDNFASVSLSSNVTTLVIAGTATQKIYICAMNFVVSSATAINLVEGVGSLCNTNVQGVFGGTATASGWNFAANGGLTQGTGVGMIGKTANAGNGVCLQNSTNATIAGGISWTKF